MNSRTISIANTKTQRRYQIESAATTLGELKAQLAAQGIDYSGMTFTEGISKTQLLSDDSLLPTNVMYKGAPTNNLVMLLTNTTKNISSGAISRKEAYRLIKEMGLQDAVMDGEGQNYTRVKTEILEEYININSAGIPEPVEEPATPAVPNIKSAPHPEAVEWFYLGIKAMVKSGLIYVDDVAIIADLTTELYKRLKEEQPKVTDDDIDNMIAEL